MQPRAPRPPIWALVLVTTMSPLALNIFLPSMPSMAKDFAVPTAAIQPALSLYFFGVAIGQLIYGPISDRVGRRPVLLFGTVVFALTNVFLVITPNVEGLIWGRAAQAFGGCSGMVLTRAIVRDVYDKTRAASAMGYITTAMVVAPALAPWLGAMMDVAFGWRASFAFLAVYSALLLPLIARYIGETNISPIPRIDSLSIVRNYGFLLRAPVFRAYLIAISFGAMSFFAFVAGAPHVVEDILGGTPVDYAQYFLLPAGGYMAGSFIAGRYARRLGLHRMLRIGAGLMATGAILVLGQGLWGASYLGLFGPVALVSLGSGLVYPPATAGALSVRPQIAGAASGLLGFSPLFLSTGLSEVIGRSFAFGPWPFFALYAASCLISVLASHYALRLERRAAG
ncbi:MAG: multidrug effflux MFS transporter [Pseudomonadota bacterium]